MLKLRLFPYKLELYSQDLIDKFKRKDNMLKHARFEKGLTRGFFFVTRKTNKLIGYIAWEKDMIIALEVTEKYQGQGFAKKLLNIAINHGADKLTVNKSNENAIEIYKHLGWEEYKKTDTMIFMQYKKTEEN